MTTPIPPEEWAKRLLTEAATHSGCILEARLTDLAFQIADDARKGMVPVEDVIVLLRAMTLCGQHEFVLDDLRKTHPELFSE